MPLLVGVTHNNPITRHRSKLNRWSEGAPHTAVYSIEAPTLELGGS